MRLCPMNSKKLIVDSVIDTGTLKSAILEADLRNTQLLAPKTNINEGPPPKFQILLVNGQLETPSATVELQFENRDMIFKVSRS